MSDSRREAQEPCRQLMRGIYDQVTTCARPKGHSGKHDPIWNHEDWPLAAVGVSDSPDADLTAQTEDEPVKSTSSVSASATERPDARAEVDGPSGLREQLAAARAAERIEFGMRQKAEDECGRLQEQLADVASQSEFFRQRALAAEAQTGELREQLDAARQALKEIDWNPGGARRIARAALGVEWPSPKKHV